MKKIIALLLALVMVVALASTGLAFADDAKTVGISMPTKSLERWNRDGSYLQEQFEAAGYKVLLTYSDNDAVQQNNDIANMIADGVDLLIITAIDSATLSQTLADAADAGIPVIAYDRLIENAEVAYYVSFDNYTPSMSLTLLISRTRATRPTTSSSPPATPPTPMPVTSLTVLSIP